MDVPADKENHVSIYSCHGKGHSQYFEYHKGLLKKDTQCVELEGSKLVFKKHEHLKYDENQVSSIFSKKIW